MRIHYNPIKASSDKLLSQIKQYIQKLYDTAYGGKADFSDLSRVPILVNYDGYTDKVVSRVLLDLINYRIVYEENGKIKKVINKFANLPEMWKALQKMNTDTFQSMSVYSSTYTNANRRKYNNEVKSMRIYSNKKRPVKASNDGRKWVNTELTQDEYAKFRDFLKKKGYKYETSGVGDMVHIEAYLNEAEIQEADKFLDTLDGVNSACGKKSVKSNTYETRVDYLVTIPGLTDEAAALYDGGWRDGEQEELMKEYGMDRDHAEDLCLLFKEYDRRASDNIENACSKKSVKSSTGSVFDSEIEVIGNVDSPLGIISEYSYFDAHDSWSDILDYVVSLLERDNYVSIINNFNNNEIEISPDDYKSNTDFDSWFYEQEDDFYADDDVNAACGKKFVKASNEGRSDLIYVIMVNGDPVAKGSYDAMVKKSYTYNYPVQMLKFPKAKLNSLMKMAKDAHRPDPLKFAVNRFINDYTDEYDSLNASCTKKSVKASYGGWGKFYGLDDVEFTVPNDMDDPTIFYNGKYYNYYDIEDTLWNYYKEDCDENGVIPDENDFENWVSNNSYLVYDLLDEISPKSKPGRGVVRSSTNRRKSVKASYTVEYFSFDELTPDQQTYVIEHWADMDELYYLLVEWWDEYQMDMLQYDEKELASEYNQNYGLSINPDKIYWQSNSQGPYPEWDLSQVFDEYQLNDGTEIYFYGRGLDVEAETDSWGEEVESPEIDEVVGHAQEYINKVWSWIHDVCTSFPEKDWIFDMLDANAVGDFYIKSDGTVGYK